MGQDFNEPCGYCGKTFRSHCFARQCRLYWVSCNERMGKILDPLCPTNGICSKCGFGLKDHYRHEPPAITVEGETITPDCEVIVCLPAEYVGCPRASLIWI